MTEEKKDKKRVITKPGTKRFTVALAQTDYDLLTTEADGRPVSLWATRILVKHCDSLRKEAK